MSAWHVKLSQFQGIQWHGDCKIRSVMESFYDLFTMFDAFSWLETAFRLSLAILAGAILGWDRERQQKPAGLRTHMMVALGSAAFMLATLELTSQFSKDTQAISIDPTRALAGIVGGIGFLGAGSIIEARGSIRGMTTAASIWVVAAIGVACGAGMYQIAFTTVLLAILVLAVVGVFEAKAFDDTDAERE